MSGRCPCFWGPGGRWDLAKHPHGGSAPPDAGPTSHARPGLGASGGFLGSFLSLTSRTLTPRPLKNASDGALMDDNQNEWGDEDLETKKFRVSRKAPGLPGSWAPATGLP